MNVRCAEQKGLSITIVGAGLSLIVKMAGDIISCAEWLFEYPEIVPLDEDGACRALVKLTIESEFELMEEVVMP